MTLHWDGMNLIQELNDLIVSAASYVHCRRVGTGGNYGYYDDCGECPECEWHKKALELVPALQVNPDIDILISQRRSSRRYDAARNQNRADLQRWGAVSSASARKLYTEKYVNYS